MSARRASRRFVVASLACGLVAAVGSASAAPPLTPTIWAKARSAVVAKESAALDAADHETAMQQKTEGVLRIELPEDVARLHTLRAARALEEAGGETSHNPLFLARFASLLHDLGEYPESARIDSALVKSSAPPWIKVNAHADLAIANARAGKVDEEIASYESALDFDTVGASRAVLLSNQAEAYMVRGDVARAIAGYRASLDSLSSREMPGAATTLWSLGVALDRSGDLEGALSSIARARSYDPTDRQLQPPHWFFVPDYDSAWYAALGELLVARAAKDPWVRQAAYRQSIDDFREYVERAGDKDTYLPIARARLKLVEKEAAALDKKIEHLPKVDEPSAITPLPLPH